MEVTRVLLCNIVDVKPGAKLAAAVIKHDAPEVELLKPGVKLEKRMLDRLRDMGVRQLWIDHDLAADLDRTIDQHVVRTKLEVYRQLKSDLVRASQSSITNAQVKQYQQIITQLVNELAGAGRIGLLTDSLFQCSSDQMTHGVNVAHLAILIGLQLESYIIRERPRLNIEHARDLVSLGLGAALHDIGKAALPVDAARAHEVHLDHCPWEDDESETSYAEHTIRGYEMLRDSGAPASACQAVRNHHQRFDGAGWPEAVAKGREPSKPLAGRRIHIFTRIVTAANALDNLMRTPEGQPRPTVAALAEFAGSAFDGWFDPIIRQAALKCIPPFAVGSMVKLNDDRQAIVIQPSMSHPCRPVVRLLASDSNQRGTSSSDPKAVDDGENKPASIDLSQHPELHIAACAGVDVSNWHFDLPRSTEPESSQAA